MGVKQCALCDLPARMHCESDQASLCWRCDAKVHGANFLVARHSRRLLCRSCQLPTPWKAEGVQLGPTVSVCQRCTAAEGGDYGDRAGGGHRGSSEGESGAGVREMNEDDGEGNEEEEEEEEEDEDEEDDGENQVVPWSLTPPPPVESSSSGEESDRFRNGGCFLKRMRENADLAVSQGNLDCSSSRSSYHASDSSHSPAPAAAEDEATSFASALRPPKDRKRTASRPAAGSAVIGLRLVSPPNRYRNPEA